MKTNEPGTSNQDPAHVEVVSNAKHHDHYGQQSIKHIPIYHEHHNIKHTPTPVYREHHSFKHTPSVAHHHAKPLKHYSSYNFDNFSPFHGYSYRPSSFLRYKPHSGLSNGFGGNFGKHHVGYHTSNPLHGSSLGLNHESSLGLSHGSSLGLSHGSSLGLGHGSSLGLGHGSSLGLGHGSSLGLGQGSSLGLGQGSSLGLGHGSSLGLNHGSLLSSLSNLEELDGYSSSSINKDEIDKLIEEAKNKGHYSSNIDGFSGFDDFDGLDGHNKGKIEKIIGNLKHKSQYSGGNNNFNHKNYHIREFRNIGNHKYSRSSNKDY